MNDKVKCIYLHVGMPKTATTSIQITLFNNMIPLEKNGYYYPKKWLMNHSMYIFSIFNDEPEKYQMNIRAQRDREACIKQNKIWLDAFEEEINNICCENLIISSEITSDMKKENLNKMLDYFRNLMPEAKIVIVICTRQYVKYLGSLIQHKIKNESMTDMEKYTDPKEPMEIYRPRIENFIDIFEPENIIIYKFEDAVEHKYGPAGFFLEKIGFSDNLGEFKIHKANEGTSNRSIDIISYINERVPFFKDHKINRGRYMGDTKYISGLSGKKYVIPIELQKKLHEFGKNDVKWLKENTGIDYTETGILFTEPKDMIFDKKYENEIKKISKKLSPVLLKLSYNYFTDKLESEELDSISKTTIENLIIFYKTNFNKMILSKSLEELINIIESMKRKVDMNQKIQIKKKRN